MNININDKLAVIFTGYGYALIEKRNNGKWYTILEAETEQEIFDSICLGVVE